MHCVGKAVGSVLLRVDGHHSSNFVIGVVPKSTRTHRMLSEAALEKILGTTLVCFGFRRRADLSRVRYRFDCDCADGKDSSSSRQKCCCMIKKAGTVCTHQCCEGMLRNGMAALKFTADNVVQRIFLASCGHLGVASFSADSSQRLSAAIIFVCSLADFLASLELVYLLCVHIHTGSRAVYPHAVCGFPDGYEISE